MPDNEFASKYQYPHVLTRRVFTVMIIPRRGSERERQCNLQARRERDRARRAAAKAAREAAREAAETHA